MAIKEIAETWIRMDLFCDAQRIALCYAARGWLNPGHLIALSTDSLR
jgi:hypothetical protein